MKKSHARKIKGYLSLLPKWVYYLGSLFIAGPVGPIIFFILFTVLDRAENVLDDDSDETASTYSQTFHQYRPSGAGNRGNVVVGDDYTVRDEEPAAAASASSSRKQSQKPFEEEEIPSFDSSDVREIIAQGERALQMIQRANSRIPDPTLSATIDSIETSCRQILDILGQKEEILPQMRTFLRYYLPTTLKLLNARAKLDRSAYTVKAREVRSRINKALGEVDAAFKKQLESLDEYRFVDLESEIDVLTDMLKADGLLDEENDRQTQAGY